MEALSKENRYYFMGIAILLVILHHFCLRFDTAWHVDTFPFTWFYWGNIGVDLFFFASAYGCCASWEHNKWWKYLVKRVKRIWPQYILFLVIVLVWFYADASVLHRCKMAVYSLFGLAPIYKLGVNVEWYTPSLIMSYLMIPLLCLIMKCANRGGQTLIVVVAILLSPALLKISWIYYAFQARVPVILCGVVAYLNRDDKQFLLKFFAGMMLLMLTTRENMMIHSMMIPLLMTSLSMVDLDKLWGKKFLSYCGEHSFELFLAQTITTQFVMQRYFWVNQWVSLGVVIVMTAAFFLLFRGWQLLYMQTINRLVIKK